MPPALGPAFGYYDKVGRPKCPPQSPKGVAADLSLLARSWPFGFNRDADAILWVEACETAVLLGRSAPPARGHD